jgi:hypothetical protein
MGKKDKSVFALAEDFQKMIAMIPKLEAFIKVHNEIAAGYQKYRKNGGEAIPGIEKHLGLKEQTGAPSKRTKDADTDEAKTAKKAVEIAPAKKCKKKLKK